MENHHREMEQLLDMIDATIDELDVFRQLAFDIVIGVLDKQDRSKFVVIDKSQSQQIQQLKTFIMLLRLPIA